MRPDIRDAASVILLRDVGTIPRILIGQRGKAAAFMPSKFVFPGGALDPGDGAMPLAGRPGARCMARLAQGLRPETPSDAPELLLRTAIRELWEETGLQLGRADPGAAASAAQAPPDWRDFLERGVVPSAEGMSLVFRAITPPGRPRRFDARFFLAPAEALAGDPDDFSAASDELSLLQWVPLAEVRAFDLPFITLVVLAEVDALIEAGAWDDPPAVPYFRNAGGESGFLRL
ncbi:MAG: NUDIX hydrolase [Rhodobacteraceae bacterium]|nr:NUDIX hydrolase [Paracoccaceae bacterium]